MRSKTFTTALALLIALAAINYLASRHPLRLDLTQDRIYTLSGSTTKMVEGLDDVLTIRVYFSRDLPPALTGMRRDVDDMLAEFKDAAGDRIQIEQIDPASSAAEEQRIMMLGVLPVQYNLYGGDRVEVAMLYLGMAVLYRGRQEVIPVVQNTANLEYLLAEAILRVSRESSPRIGWIEGRPPEDELSAFRLIRQAISRTYEVVDLSEDGLADLDPERIEAIALLSPRNLSRETLFAIDQYLMRGGRAMALVDRWDVDPKLALAPVETDAIKLMSRYGAEIEDALVVDESNAMAAFSGGVVTYHIHYPFWPEVRGQGFSRAQPITADMESVVLPWTAPIELASEGPEREATVAKSSDQSAAVETKGVDLEPRQAANLVAEDGSSELTLAALVEGPFDSYFAGTGQTPPAGETVIAKGDSRAKLFVVGSSRWAQDRFLQRFPQNATLFQNALDYLAMSDVLIGIRSRQGVARPIALMPDSAKAFLRYANVAVGPLALAALGFAALIISRRARRRARMIYGSGT